MGRGSRGRGSRCREQSPWAGIACRGDSALNDSVCGLALESLIRGPGGSGALAEGCQGPESLS